MEDNEHYSNDRMITLNRRGHFFLSRIFDIYKNGKEVYKHFIYAAIATKQNGIICAKRDLFYNLFSFKEHEVT